MPCGIIFAVILIPKAGSIIHLNYGQEAGIWPRDSMATKPPAESIRGSTSRRWMSPLSRKVLLFAN